MSVLCCASDLTVYERFKIRPSNPTITCVWNGDHVDTGYHVGGLAMAHAAILETEH